MRDQNGNIIFLDASQPDQRIPESTLVSGKTRLSMQRVGSSARTVRLIMGADACGTALFDGHVDGDRVPRRAGGAGYWRRPRSTVRKPNFQASPVPQAFELDGTEWSGCGGSRREDRSGS